MRKPYRFYPLHSMVGLLPVPHAIVVRKYQPNTFTSLWFTAFYGGLCSSRTRRRRSSTARRSGSCKPGSGRCSGNQSTLHRRRAGFVETRLPGLH